MAQVCLLLFPLNLDFDPQVSCLMGQPLGYYVKDVCSQGDMPPSLFEEHLEIVGLPGREKAHMPTDTAA